MVGITVLMLAAALQVSAQPNTTTATAQPSPRSDLNGVTVPSKAEFRILLRGARTAHDERRIAAYYLNQAERFAQKAGEEQEISKEYARRTVFEPKTGYPGGMLQHCRELAFYDAQRARQFRNLAIMHERLAEGSAH